MSPPPWSETLRIAVAVIVTRAHCCLTAADHCYVILGTINFVDKSVSDDSVCRSNHCDVISPCSELRCAAHQIWTSNCAQVIHNSSFWIKHKPTHGLNSWRHIHQIQHVSLFLSFCTIRAIAFIWIQSGWQCSLYFSKHKIAAVAVQWELCGTNVRENIANLRVSFCNGNKDFLGCCSPSTLETGRKITSKSSQRSGFDCIIRPAPSNAGRTTPSQPGHYPLNIIECGTPLFVEVTIRYNPKINFTNYISLASQIIWKICIDFTLIIIGKPILTCAYFLEHEYELKKI